MIFLNPLTKKDLSFLLEVRNDKSTRFFLENDSIFSLEECEKWFKDTNPEWFIILSEDGQKVGYLRTNGDEIGCDIHPNFRRNGYARMAYNEYLKNKNYASLWVFEDNFAKKLYESLGFVENGETKLVRNRKYIKMIYKNYKTCYVINFYFGDRRKTPKIYNEDRLIFLKKQIEYLKKIKHNVDNIVFSFNLNHDDFNIIYGYINNIPKRIQNSNIEIVLRKNNGMSYAAWSEYTIKNIDRFDYFIYNEDDYFFSVDNFDKYLVDTFEKYDNCGYLCAISREPSGWNNFKKHAGYAGGITNRKNIKKVFDDFKLFSKIEGNEYKMGESLQIDFTHCFVKNGMEIYDVREKYRVPFSTTLENEPDVIYFFNYNNEDLLIPLTIDQGNFTWTIADLKEFEKY